MNILVVDDEIYVRKTICSIIHERFDKFFDIFQADSYANAMEIFSQISVDMLITDIRMCGETGIELAQSIREIQPDCGIIFISAYDNKSYLKSAIALGAVAYIEKPINECELVEALSVFYSEFINKSVINSKKNENDKSALVEKMIHINSNSNVKENFESVMGIDIDSLNFKVGIIRYLPKRVDLITETLLGEKISALSQNCGKMLYQKKSNGVYVVIYMTYKGEVGEKQYDIFCEICAELNKISDVLVATGDFVDDYRKIISSYDDAAVAMELAFYGEYGEVAKTFNTDSLSDKSAFNVFDSIERFDKLAKKYDKNSIIEYIDAVYRQFVESRNLPSSLVIFLFKQYIYHVYLMESGSNPLPMNDFDNALENMEFLTFGELYKYTVEEIKRCFEKIKNDKLIADIEKYIDDNYKNPNLSISEISNTFHMSISYICTKYKKVTNNTINGYITSVRMQRAKTLLLKNEYSSEQVSEMVGYRDPNYFSRNFKKFYGITVTEFKKRL